MTVDKYQDLLNLLDIDLKDGKSRVLKAIIHSQQDTEVGVTFEQLRKSLVEDMGGKKIAKPLIYRYLKSLEEGGFIEVDRNSNPNRYVVNISTLKQGVDRRKSSKIEELRRTIDRQKDTNSLLSSTTAIWLARALIEMLSGEPYEGGSRSVQGKNQIQDLIFNEIYSRGQSGDVIRTTLDWDFTPGDMEERNRKLGFELFANKVTMKFLLHDPSRVDEGLLKERLQIYQLTQSDPNIAKYVQTRVSYKTAKTYQGVCLNRDAIVLIVSEDPFTGVWIPRHANQKLVEEVVDKFDRDFEKGSDLLEMLTDS